MNEDVLLDLEPLRALGIDRGTLEEFGLNSAQIRDVYRNLYIGTSLSFDMLADLTKHNTDRQRVN